MKKFLFFFLLPFFLTAQAQNSDKKIDSLIANADYTHALTLIRSQANPSPILYNKEAEVLMALGKLDDAENILSKSIDNSSPLIIAITDSNLGFLYLLKGRSDRALDKLQLANKEFGSSGNGNTKEAARCLANLSLLYWSSGKFNQAEENGLAALQLRQSIFGNESEEAAASLNDLGLVYGQTDPDKALTYYEQALAVYEKLHQSDHPKIAIAKTNIGLMYLKSELYGDAVNNFESAQSIWKKNYPQGHPNEALALANLAQTYKRMRNDNTALSYYEKALAIYKKSYGDKHPDIASVYNQIGNIKLGENKFQEALQDFQEALCANSSFNQKNISANPSVASFYNSKVLLYSLQAKAEALEGTHYRKTLKLQDLVLALNTLHSCDTLIDNIRHQSENENDKIELGALANEVYEDGVRLAFAISQVTLHSKVYREVAFYFAEKSKSAVLQESIADAQAKSFAGIPGDLLEDEKNRKSSIAILAQKLSEKPGADEEKRLRGLLFSATTQYEQFIKKLEHDYPEYYNLKFRPATASVSDVQNILQPDQAVVSYFIAEKNKRLYQFTILQKKFSVRNLSIPENFERNCKGLTNSLLFSDFNTYQNTVSLSQLLKPSLPKSIKRLIIIPSGRLGSIPFEALTAKKTKGDDFSKVSFFINRWAISYEFAAGLMLQKGKVNERAVSENIFLCAPINFNETTNLSSLPGTETEVNSIAKLFSGKAKVSTHQEANESMVKSNEVTRYNYLHFATHGIVDASDPALSRIFLSSEGNEDGSLYCGEIYNLTMNAELVVLSACETGLGKISTGEGVIGLSRALVYAGAKNIIVSFWKVADESTAALMVDFYKVLLQKNNKDFSEALRQAKLDLINDGKHSSPYYWAPFVLIGK